MVPWRSQQRQGDVPSDLWDKVTRGLSQPHDLWASVSFLVDVISGLDQIHDSLAK